MKTRSKWLLGVSLLLVTLVVIVPLLFALLVDEEYAKRQISNAVETRTGRPLLIEGELGMAFGVKPRLVARAIRYPNADWGKHRWAIEVDEAALTVDLWALLRGKVLVTDVVLRKPRLRVEKNASGAYNLSIARPRLPLGKTGPPPRSFPAWLGVSSVDIVDGEITVATRYRHWDILLHEARAQSAGRDQPVAIEARGEVEETPVTATATLGSPETLFAEQSSPFTLDGIVGADGNRLSARGSVRNVLKWRGVDLRLDFEAAQLAELSKLAIVPLPNIAPLSGHARLYQPEGIFGMQLREVEVNSTQFGLRGTLTGTIPKLYRLGEIDLSLTATGILDRELTDWAHAFAPRGLDASVTARLRGSRRDAELTVETATAKTAGLLLTANGAFTRTDGGKWRAALPVSLTVSDFNALNIAGAPGGALARVAPVTASAELRREQAEWHLRDIALSLERDALAVRVAGAVERLGRGFDGNLTVTAAADDGRYLQPLFDAPLPPLSALQLQAGVAFERGVLRADVARLEGRAYGADWSASGAIAELNRWRGVALAVRAESGAAGLAQLPPAMERALPVMGALRLRAKLADDDEGAFHLTDITAANADPDRHIAVQAAGEIRNLGATMRADINWDARLETAQPLRRWQWLSASESAALLERAMPLSASGNLYSSDAARWGIRNIEAVSLAERVEASLAGEVTAFAPPEARLRLSLERVALADAAPTLPWKIPQPRDGELDLSLDLVAESDAGAGAWRIENIRAALNSPGATFAARGAIERLIPLQINRMDLEFDATSVASLGWANTGPLKRDNPVSGSLALSLGAPGNRADLNLAIGASDLRGTVEWRRADDAQTPSRFEAKLVSDRLDIREMLLKAPPKSRFFSPAPINTNWIHKLSGQLDLSAGEARNSLLDMSDVTVRMTLREGTLQQRIAGRMGQGALTASLDIDANARPLVTELKVSGKQLDTAGLVAFHKNNFLDSGTFDLDFDFSAEGHSAASLAAHANGHGLLRLNQTKIKNQSMDIIGGDIFSNIITAVNPFRQIGEYVTIECGVMRFDIEQGVAKTRDGLAVKTDRVTLLGGGNVNLGDESLRIILLPKARKGFGINSSSLAKVVRVGGTLANPKIEGDASRLLQSSAEWLAAFYTGGWSLVAKGLIDRTQANADVCGLNGGVDEAADGEGVSVGGG